MLSLIKRVVSSPGPEPNAEAEGERIQIATCVLLLEMAHTDGEFHPMEATLVRDLMQDRFGLSVEATAELTEFAQKQRESSLDLFQFTRQVNENFTVEEKQDVMEALWRIVYVDGVLDKYEDYLVRQMATLLRLSHRQMIDAKLKVLQDVRAKGDA
ncbi:MAG: TerB family tellurite resistance protein [Desulfuromonas sp.]|uniref:tellurite resistance TerB family protein n=1 Tax=Desulfuromonas sp. TaxID=892 RepID=UPI000CCB80D0|nr:TerB family tellurite resistance protein [Desulfuromonas sp.]PLX86486.1 MAG: TerB family tellurite resistance protein [Desulfuromonas sp.]